MKSLLTARRTLLNLGVPGSPYSVPGAIFWIRADLGVAFASGTANVDTVTEQSGRALVLTSLSTQRPGFSATGFANGKAQIDFGTGTGGFLSIPPSAFSGVGDSHSFWVLASPTASAQPSAGIWTLGSSTDSDRYPNSDDKVYLGVGSTARKVVAQTSEAAASTRVPHILEVISTGGEYTVRNGTIQYRSFEANTPGWASSPKLGQDLGGVKWLGRLGEGIIWPRKLALHESLSVRSALRNRFAFTGAYSNAAPAPTINASSIAGCVMWLDPLAVVLDGGGGVVTATDISIGKGDYGQSTAARRPTITSPSEEGFNGQRAFRFVRASQQYLIGPTFAGLTSAELFIAVQPTYGIANMLMRMGSEPNQTWWPNSDSYGYTAFGSTSRKATSGPLFNGPHILNVVTAPGEFSIFVDGMLSSTTTDNVVGWNALGSLLGAGNSGGMTPADFFDGLIGVMAVYDHKLSGTDKATAQSGFRGRFVTA